MAGLTTSLGADIIGTQDQQRAFALPPQQGDAFVPMSAANRLMTPIQFFNDEVDQSFCNLVVLIPGDVHVVGHVIGKGGAEVTRIEQESGASVKIESQVPRPLLGTGLERTVVISGSIASCVRAQRLLDRRIRIRLESDGIHREVLRVVVPNEFVRHLIGKSGANISQLQNSTGVRIQVQAESTHPFGRAITLQGVEMGRSLAQYLISRQIAEGPYREWPNNLQVAAAAAAAANGAVAVPPASVAVSSAPSIAANPPWSPSTPATNGFPPPSTSPPRKSTPFTPHAQPFYPTSSPGGGGGGGGGGGASAVFQPTPTHWGGGHDAGQHEDTMSRQLFVPHVAVVRLPPPSAARRGTRARTPVD